MLAVYCDRSERDRIRFRLRKSSMRPRFTEDWGEFRRALEETGHGLVLDRDATTRTFDRIQSLKTLYPSIPLVLATPVDALSWRHLKDVRVEELVALERLDHELEPALVRADGEQTFYAIRDRIRSSTRPYRSLARTLARAVERRPPYSSVRALSEDSRVDRRTLWHHWSAAMGPEDDLGLKGFLDWVLLLRGAVARTGRSSWKRVAEELGVHLRTLRRISHRTVGHDLQGLDGLRREELFDRFRREVLDRLAP